MATVPDKAVQPFIIPIDRGQAERKKMEAEARRIVQKSIIETGYLPKEELLLRVDPKYAAAVEAEGRRIYNQAMKELTIRKAREAALHRKIKEELRREKAAAARKKQRAEDRLAAVLTLVSRHIVEDCRAEGLHPGNLHANERTLASLAQTCRVANRIASFYRWPLVWHRAEVAATLGPRVVNLIKKGSKILLKQPAEVKRALDNLIEIICDPHVSASDTRRALDAFMSECFKGYPPPQDLYTKALEFTSAKSLWLARRRLFQPGADSTRQNQKIPDFVSALGPGDNIKTAGINKVTPIKGKKYPLIEPDLDLDPNDPTLGAKMLTNIESCYNSVMTDISKKVSKYHKYGKVIVTVDATAAPWMSADELRRRLRLAGWSGDLAAVFLIKNGKIEDAWP